MIFDKAAIKQIALNRFHDKYFETPLDLLLHAVEVYMKERNLDIVDKKLLNRDAPGGKEQSPKEQK